MKKIFSIILTLGLALTSFVGNKVTVLAETPANYVILISVDGLRPDVITNLGPDRLPNFYRLRSGAATDNARNDAEVTITLPTHVTEATSRNINGTDGHNWSTNVDPLPGETIQSNKGSYVASVFDVVHDNGLSTSLYAGKTKFSLFDTSYNSVNGATDVTGEDNGQDKIDSYLYLDNTASLVSSFTSAMQTNPTNFSMVHIRNLDSVGHASGWNPAVGSAYANEAITVDGYLGSIISLVENNTNLAGNTTIIMTADHGGQDYDHSIPTLQNVYTIPFYVWGKDVAAGADLYDLNAATRLDPGTGHPTYTDTVQPIRNGESGNLALSLLGLPAIPGSVLDASEDLTVAPNTTSLQFESATSNISENGANATVSVTRTGLMDTAVSVDYATSDGSALVDADYTATAGTLYWAAGDDTSKTITIPVLDDAVYEGIETFNVILNNPVGANLGSVNTSAVQIIDDETPPLPAAPTNLSATTVSGSQINLAWSDNSDNETGFRIERKTGVDGTYGQVATVEANATSYADNGLNSSTEYFYRVNAYHATGNSGYSNEVSATTLAVPVTYNPSSYDVVLGSFSSSTVDCLTADDNLYLITASQTTGTTRYATTDFSITGISNSNPSSIDIQAITKSNKTATQKMYVYNYSIDTWELIDTTSVRSTELLREVTLGSNASNYISGGAMQLRIEAAVLKNKYSFSHELISVTVNP